MSAETLYQNPLVTRYGSPAMASLFSEHHKALLWRKLWTELARAGHDFGLPITDAQIRELEAGQTIIDFANIREHERQLRHEIMAHVQAYGDVCPLAKPILHWGATSCDISDNADLIIMRDAMQFIEEKLLRVMKALAVFARQTKDIPTLGLTHLQSAQLTTVGKRATLYLQDLLSDYHELQALRLELRFKGFRGATGTQASFLVLMNHDVAKVKALEQQVAHRFGFDAIYPVSGQTYPRKLDYRIVSWLSSVAQSAAKFAVDTRLLQSRNEVEEPIETSQIGSSAMAYKRNPMRCERINSLARVVQALPTALATTASQQWMERTLDDSAAKRILIPQAFLAVDGILSLYHNVIAHLKIYPKMMHRAIMEELPFLATEEILMEYVRAGGDRQLGHERIRVLAHQAAVTMKEQGVPNPLFAHLQSDPLFAPLGAKLTACLDPYRHIGRASEQVEEFLVQTIDPLVLSVEDDEEAIHV
jgi:adenylosuccinate lyase